MCCSVHELFMKNLVAVFWPCGRMALSAKHNTPNPMTPKPYNSFSDVHGNRYSFTNLQSFLSFWFSIPYHVAIYKFDRETFVPLTRIANLSK